MNKTVQPFSAGYYMVEADIVEHTGDDAIVAHDYYGELANYVTQPLLRYSGEHYWAYPERAVPANTVVVPDVEDSDDDAVLMAKDETAHRLVSSGEKRAP